MRIIGGEFKGRVIEMPRGIRPTSDKVREALFEILKDHIEGAAFLDLYCGGGAVGIEACSRGAKGITFVDNNAKCIAVLRKNLARLNILDKSSIDIYNKDARKIAETLLTPFDIVFLDPPYYKDVAKNTLMTLSDCDILARNAIIVIEAYKKEFLPDEAGMLKKVRTREYGDTKLEFYKK